MLDILLIHPDYPWPNKYPPMGLLYLAGYLEKTGDYRVKIVDLAVEGVSNDDLINVIENESPKLIGISFMTPQSLAAYDMARMIREKCPDTGLVAGGVHTSALPEEVLEFFDMAVIGEGEVSFKEIADYFVRNEGSLDQIKGLALKENGRVIKNTPREFIADLDMLPFPSWHHLDLSKYKGLGMGLDEEKPFMVVLSSRGCPNDCIFCASRIVHGRPFRYRSAENIIEEIEEICRNYGINQFDFADDTMTVSKKRMMRFCELITSEGLDITWDCNARVNTVDEEMLSMMKKAGCRRVNFGVESGDQRILDRLKKGIKLSQIKRAHSLAKLAGLKTMSFFMIGNPGEGAAEIERTRELAREISSDCPGLTFATPYPGTQLLEMARERGWLDGRGWDEYTTTITGDGFLPVMRNDRLNRRELLSAYKTFLSELKKG
jgi:radical SAM superfamily enzyme YgiQ (UPF0313 family)